MGGCIGWVDGRDERIGGRGSERGSEEIVGWLSDMLTCMYK